MTQLIEHEIQQILLAILDVAAGRKYATGKRQNNPTPFLLDSGKKIDITAAAAVCNGVGISIRNHSDPENEIDVCLRIDVIEPTDIMMIRSTLGIIPGTIETPLGRILKQSESLPATNQVD